MKIDLVLPPSLIPCDFVEAVETECNTEMMPFSVALEGETLKALAQDVPQAATNAAIPFAIVQFLTPDTEQPRPHLATGDAEDAAAGSARVLPSLLGLIWTELPGQNLPGQQSLPTRPQRTPEAYETGTVTPSLAPLDMGLALPVSGATPTVLAPPAVIAASPTSAQALPAVTADVQPTAERQFDRSQADPLPSELAAAESTFPVADGPTTSERDSGLVASSKSVTPDHESQNASDTRETLPAKDFENLAQNESGEAKERPESLDRLSTGLPQPRSEDTDRAPQRGTSPQHQDVDRAPAPITTSTERPSGTNEEFKTPAAHAAAHDQPRLQRADEAPQVSLPPMTFVSVEELVQERKPEQTARLETQKLTHAEILTSDTASRPEALSIANSSNNPAEKEIPKSDDGKADLRDLDIQVAARPRTSRGTEIHLGQHSEVRPEPKDLMSHEAVTSGPSSIGAPETKHHSTEPARVLEVRDTAEPSQWAQVERADVLSQLIEKARALRWDRNSEIVVSLKPESLGRISMRASLVDRTMVATLAAESESVRQILQLELPTIQRSLQDQGIIARVAVAQETALNFAGSNSSHGQPRFSNGTDLPFREHETAHNPAAILEVADARYSTHSVHLIA